MATIKLKYFATLYFSKQKEGTNFERDFFLTMKALIYQSFLLSNTQLVQILSLRKIFEQKAEAETKTRQLPKDSRK